MGDECRVSRRETALRNAEPFAIVQDSHISRFDFLDACQLNVLSVVGRSLNQAFPAIIEYCIARLEWIPSFSDASSALGEFFSPKDMQVWAIQILVSGASTGEEFFTGGFLAGSDVNVFGVVEFLQTTIVAAVLDEVDRGAAFLGGATGNYKGVVGMSLFKLQINTLALSDVAVGVSTAEFVDKPPPHDIHEGFRSVAKFRFPAIEETVWLVIGRCVTPNAESYEITWAVSVVILPVPDVVNLQDFLLGVVLAVRVLALVIIPVNDILPDIPKAGLLTFLVFGAFDVRVVNFLDVEGGDFDGGFGDREYLVQQGNESDMGVFLVFDTRGQPTIGPFSVVKTGCPVA